MNIMEFFKKIALKIAGNVKQTTDPNDKRLTFISDETKIREQKAREYKIWYVGDSDELLNLYLNQRITDFKENLIYNRNNKQYFWSQCQDTEKIKRIHSGMPNAIITTLVNIVGNPDISSKSEVVNEKVNEFIEKYDFTSLLNQQQLPLTLVEGYGAFKLGFDAKKEIYLQYYDACNVEFVAKHGKTIGIIYKDYYTNGKDNYVLIETRYKDNGNCKIIYRLFKLGKNNELKHVELGELEATKDLQDIVIENYDKLFGVESKLLYDALHSEYGRSIFEGKLDLFDDLDMTLSVCGKAVQSSLPITYLPSTSLQRINGIPVLPSDFKSTFVITEDMPNGDGLTGAKREILQAQLNIEQYHSHYINTQNIILTGTLSASTLGIDVSKKDNADAQREKEKVSIFTSQNIESKEKKIVKEIITQYLDLLQYLEKGNIEQIDYELSVGYKDFINPSFEQVANTVISLTNANIISTEKAIDMLWGDNLSDEEKQAEISRIKEQQKSDNLDLGAFENNELATSMEAEGTNDNAITNFKE